MEFETVYRFASFELGTRSRRLRRNGRELHLRPREFALLLVLVENPGRVLEREWLLQSVWHDREVEDSNLTQAVSELRRMLAEDPASLDGIETVPKHGYRFTVPIQRLEVPIVREGLWARRLLRWSAATAVVLLALLAGYQAGLHRWPGGLQPIRKLGIETMQNRTGDRALDFACDLITDDVAIELDTNSNLAIVFVRPDDEQVPSQQERMRRLALDAILTMSLERCGAHSCATAQLHHVGTPHPIWSYSQRFAPEEDPTRMPNLVAEAGKALAAWAE
jgi:DNA-binding winged helix-turn-helix (wHTH) protein